MASILWMLKLYLIVCLVSSALFLILVFLDWFFYQRLPWILWRASREDWDELRFLKEVARFRRIKDPDETRGPTVT